MLAPTIFTMGNAACGFFAILAAHIGNFVVAGTAILLGIVFDMLDGRVARFVHGESEFGVEFDSLADFLTFGVAPAFMMEETHTIRSRNQRRETLSSWGTSTREVAALIAIPPPSTP